MVTHHQLKENKTLDVSPGLVCCVSPGLVCCVSPGLVCYVSLDVSPGLVCYVSLDFQNKLLDVKQNVVFLHVQKKLVQQSGC